MKTTANNVYELSTANRDAGQNLIASLSSETHAKRVRSGHDSVVGDLRKTPGALITETTERQTASRTMIADYSATKAKLSPIGRAVVKNHKARDSYLALRDAAALAGKVAKLSELVESIPTGKASKVA